MQIAKTMTDCVAWYRDYGAARWITKISSTRFMALRDHVSLAGHQVLKSLRSVFNQGCDAVVTLLWRKQNVRWALNAMAEFRGRNEMGLKNYFAMPWRIYLEWPAVNQRLKSTSGVTSSVVSTIGPHDTCRWVRATGSQYKTAWAEKKSPCLGGPQQPKKHKKLLFEDDWGQTIYVTEHYFKSLTKHKVIHLTLPQISQSPSRG